MFHCYTGTLREHKLPPPCSVLGSDNCMIVKACSRNITGEATTPLYKEKINLKFPDRFSFQGLPSFLVQEKSVKCSYFPRGCCFTRTLPYLISSKILYWEWEMFYGNSQQKKASENCKISFFFYWTSKPFFPLN